MNCQNACQHRPGFFRADQIAPLAKALNLTVKELFDQHLQVDCWNGEPDIFLLIPRHQDKPGGSLVPFDPRGTCHWFVNGRCEIHTLGKPAECAELVHAPGGEYAQVDRQAIVDSWRDNQQMVRDLYGRDLEPSDPDFTDLPYIATLLLSP
jgi:hypothetical protein